ncbi:hypothetical protein Q7P37_006085 [Cladosporium fusiforme]
MPKETERPTVELESSEEESSEDSNHKHETPTSTDESLPEVTTKLRGLNLDMSGKNPTPSGSQVNAPQEFTGARNQFDAFQMQCMIVFKMTDKYETAEKKVMFITSYLQGSAYEWIQPHLRDYLTNDEAERKPATNRMFAGANALFREMEQTFKHGSEELEAERDVQRIYQKGSAARYRAEFQILAAKTSWNDEALAAQFYRGLKDVVKDEIARGERPTTTEDMYTLAIKIDERLKQSHELQDTSKPRTFKATQGKGTEPETPPAATLAATTQDWTVEDAQDGRGAYNKQSDMDTEDGHATRRDQDISRFPTEEIEDWDLLETVAQDSESEEDSDEEMEPFNVEFLRGDLVPQLLHKIVAYRQAVFPWKNGQQWVNNTGFTNLMFDLRQMLQGVSVVEGSINYHMIVREWVPLGSDFTAQGGYSTPEGVVIPYTLRQKVREAKKEYAEQAEQQKSRQLARVQALAPRSLRAERADTNESRQLAQPVRFEENSTWEPLLSMRDPRYGKSTIQFEGLESMPLPVVHDALDKIDICAMSATELQEQVEKNPDQVQVLYCKKTEEAKTEFVIPPEYADFRQLFEKESDEEALPKHQPWDHEIKIQEGKQPKKEPLRPMTAQKAEYVRRYVDERLRKGHIRESDSPAGYPLHIVPKGDDWRKTAFRTRFGLYEYLVMPFGLTNAPATFQAYINNVLRKYLDVFVVVYLDDILALKDADMRIKPEKTEFHKMEVKFLGYIVSRDGLKMDQKKIEAVTSWPKPTTVKEVQSFLGFANFYRQFIQDYSKITAPLTHMTRKDQGYEWTAEAEAAFQELKTRFSTGPILVIYDPTKSVTVETDASDYAIGACLSQPDEKRKLRPVAYLSRKMTPAKLNYEIHDKELLAIVEAFRHWRIYLEGHPEEITVITDHKNLTKYTTTKELTPRQIRWYQDLATFKMRIHYRKGSENARADAMSRRRDYVKSSKLQTFQLLTQNADGTLQVNRIAATSAMDANSVYDEMKTEQERERILAQVRAHPEEYPAFSQNGSTGLWEFEGRTYVPTTLRKPLLTA